MKTVKKPCQSCSRQFKPLDLIEWESTYKRQDGIIVPVKRELCVSCYGKQSAIA